MSRFVQDAGNAPIIAYNTLHQALPTVDSSVYRGTMREFHDRLVEESRRLRDGETAGRPTGVSKERGPDVGIGLLISSESAISTMTLENERARTLQKNGMRYLMDLGFHEDISGEPLFESNFVVEGSRNLDVLEHLVRDVLGIYATTHGKHIKEFGEYGYSLYNLVHQEGTFPGDREGAGLLEGTFYFSKPSPEVIKYASFRTALTKLLTAVRTNSSFQNITLWQRKLGLGVGVEFVLRFLTHSHETLELLVPAITDLADPILQEALVMNSKLVVKDILFTIHA